MYRRFITAALALFSLVPARAQGKWERMQEEADRQFNDSNFVAATKLYRTVARRTGNDALFGHALYNLGVTYYRRNLPDSAKECFRRLLFFDLDEFDRGGRGEGIMGEPYAQYKHNSCEMLATIALKESDYGLALEYIRKFDVEYPYQHFCGNEYKAFDYYLATMYARAYCGLGDTARAISVLLPHVFDEGLASNAAVLRLLLPLLRSRYDLAQLSGELYEAAGRLQTGSEKINGRSYERTWVAFLNQKIEVTGVLSFGSQGNRTENIRESEFMKQLKAR
ncbi:hypothetical protein EPD60_05230 [Flaviaesturariibacter flavus]|uniref:Tetratricopeptide repeat protein n=1 Tax=Flaviaesturariibacter flavus TaxID=2502780 RepID=A0A4R1BK60_9BACT|nr:hypothetical protein [Flaviaesturariibacter flavus]TCJ17598.1 hypothetical protein EPD60_05230 [Flaviaesturariibacter flavus]